MKSVKEWLQRQGAGSPDPAMDNTTAQSNDGNPPVQPARQEQHPPAPRQNERPKTPDTYHEGRPRPENQRQPLAQAEAPRVELPKGSGLRMYPLGGFEQVGRNCFVVDVDGDLYIIDIGVQFPDENMLGIDYLIPDVSSLRGRENRIKAVLFTHGHFDHIGAAHHILPQLHFPPCFGTKLTFGLLKKKLDEEHMTSKVKMTTVKAGDRIRIGKVEVEFIRMTHSIPDCVAIALHTPYGTVLHTGDFKVDLMPLYEPPMDFQRLSELGKKGVLAIIADSTNAMKPGNSKSESEIAKSLRDSIVSAKGRIIISTFSSLVTRIQQIVDVAKETNRKVYLSGRSMEENIEIATNLGYIKAPRGLVRKAGPGMDKIPDKEVLIITTGSQGQENAGLARMGLGTHKHVTVKKGDTVLLSSNPIIGNEKAVGKVINNLHMKGASVVQNAELALHVTGHGHRNDLLLIHQLVRAKHVIPEHGEPMMKSAHAEIAYSIGYEENQVHLINNGEILEFDRQGNARKSKQKLTFHDVIVDGRGAAGEGQRVLDDRKVMSSAGVIIVLFKVYTDSKRLVGDPEVISRGLIYGSEQQDITSNVVQAAKKAYEEELQRGETELKNFKRGVVGALYRYFDRKLDREPMVIPLFVEV